MYARRLIKPKPRKSISASFPAPIGGWISNRSLALPEGKPGAAVLDNYFPRSGGVKLRRGKQLYATLVDITLPVAALFSYRNGNNERLFGANENVIYDLTNVVSPFSGEIVNEDGDLIVTEDGDWFGFSSTDGLEVMSGLTGGDWSVVQFATIGGVYLIGVNGEDDGFLYDGTTFAALSGITFVSSSLTTADMAFVWVYKNRLWFIQKDSLDAWYMQDAGAIAGDAVRFPLAGMFGLGGSLLFGQNWSLGTSDQGGLSEQNIFVSTQGEVVIYQGDDPASADNWTKVGTYRIGTPLGRRAFFRGGGDIAIATSVGLVPLSKAITLDVTSLNIATVSYPIADAWDNATALRGLQNWQCELWPEQKMAVVSPPDLIGATQPVLFVSNTETGAWCRFTGWYALCMEVFRGQLYFGSTGGEVYAANVSGMDGTQAYSGVVMPLFDDRGAPDCLKTAETIRAVSRANSNVKQKCTVNYDFDESAPVAPDSSMTPAGNLWGTGIWGQSVWGQGTPNVVNQGRFSAGGYGYAVAPVYQVTSGSIGPIDDELIRIDLNYTQAEVGS